MSLEDFRHCSKAAEDLLETRAKECIEALKLEIEKLQKEIQGLKKFRSPGPGTGDEEMVKGDICRAVISRWGVEESAERSRRRMRM